MSRQDVLVYGIGSYAVASPTGLLVGAAVATPGGLSDTDTFSAAWTDNGNGTWTSAIPIDNGDGTWTA